MEPTTAPGPPDMFNRTEAIAEIQRRNQQRAEAKLPR
jgi:hypothetical protein